MLVNSVGGVAAIILMLLVDQIPVYFACLAIAGFFLGVLFSVYVTIATRLIINMSVERHRLWEQPVAALIF